MSDQVIPGRDVLPIPDRPYPGVRPYSARDPAARFPPIRPLRPPPGAPNVVQILLDDVGFGASSAYGGPCRMPTAERLARGGIRYSRFHTAGLCASTRAALLTGRNHHTVGFGAMPELATSAPGYTGMIPNTCAPLAQVLRLNGYATAQFGKSHEVPAHETSCAGPFDRWPTGQGFQYFYGFIGGETHQYSPALYQNTTPVDPAPMPGGGYHLSADLADRCIDWIVQQKALMPDQPFFVYLAPGAAHAPHHVPAEWADRYAGRFRHGWDRLRDEIFARQRRFGVVPRDAELTQRHAEIPAWSDMPSEWKPVLERQMEVYAGFLEHADYHIGRVIDVLERIDVLGDTLIYYILGDNGASAEGTLHGTLNELLLFNDVLTLEAPSDTRATLHQAGGPDSYGHYSFGWAHAMNTPYKWTKQIASHWGGTRTGCIVHWPNGMKSKNAIRGQFHHVIDVAPTVLAAAGLPQPVSVNGVQQSPMQGVDMRYSFDDAKAPDRHPTQYFEILGNRAIYHEGWVACARHRTPWSLGAEADLETDTWELYDSTTDWTQAHDLAAEHPVLLSRLKTLFLLEAERHLVTPIDDRFEERIDPELAGRPALVTGRRQIFTRGVRRLPGTSAIVVKNRSHTVTADLDLPDGDRSEGTLIAQGGRLGGWTLYVKAGRLKYCYNHLALESYYVESSDPIPSGRHQVRMEFAYEGGGLGKGGLVTLYIDGVKVGEGRVASTAPNVASLDETVGVGEESILPVAADMTVEDSRFNGHIHWIGIDTGEDGEYLVSPAGRLRMVMAH